MAGKSDLLSSTMLTDELHSVPVEAKALSGDRGLYL